MRDLQRAFHDIFNLASSIQGYDLRDDGWKLTTNNRKTTLGVCDYAKKEIQLSKHFLHLPEIHNTIKHEIAHAYAKGDSHGPKWKSLFLKLGGTGARCASVGADSLPKHSWEVVNTLNGEVVAQYYRKPRRNFARCALAGKPETIGKLELRRVC